MVTNNADVEDRLVNGKSEEVRYREKSRKVETICIEFDTENFGLKKEIQAC